jgi:hypothetical protein
MPWVGFQPTVPASARAKTPHALDRSTTMTASIFIPPTFYVLNIILPSYRIKFAKLGRTTKTVVADLLYALPSTRIHTLYKTIRQLGRTRKSPVVDYSEAGLLLYQQFQSKPQECHKNSQNSQASSSYWNPGAYIVTIVTFSKLAGREYCTLSKATSAALTRRERRAPP